MASDERNLGDNGSPPARVRQRLGSCLRGNQRSAAALVIILALLAIPDSFAFAHGIGGKDASFVAATKEADILPFMYLGAKHMVTGYDHLLFLLGVIFFLYRMRDVVIYVTLFSIGHSITLLAGVLLTINVNPSWSMQSSACRWCTRRSTTLAASNRSLARSRTTRSQLPASA